MVPPVPQVPPASTSGTGWPERDRGDSDRPAASLGGGGGGDGARRGHRRPASRRRWRWRRWPRCSSSATSLPPKADERAGGGGHGRVDRPAGRPGGAAVRRLRERGEHEVLAGPHGDGERVRPVGRGDEPAVVRHARRRDELPRPRVRRPGEHLPERGIGRHRHDRPAVRGRRERGGHRDRPPTRRRPPPTRTRRRPARRRRPGGDERHGGRKQRYGRSGYAVRPSRAATGRLARVMTGSIVCRTESARRPANDDFVADVPGPGSSLISCRTLPSALDHEGEVVVRGHRAGGQVLDLDAVVVPDDCELARATR